MSDTLDFEKLYQFAHRLALKHCYSSSWVSAPEDAAQDMAQRVITKIQHMEDKEPGSVNKPISFVRISVKHLFISYVRKAKRRSELLKEHGEMVAPIPTTTGLQLDEDDEAEAARCLAPYVLIARNEGWSKGRARFNRKAVFLMQLRLAVLEAAGKRCPEYRPALLLRIAKQTAPWPRRERRESFYPDWPSMESIWEALEERYPGDDKVTEAKGFVVVVGELTDPGLRKLTVGQWHKWIGRSRDRARELVPEPVWASCFEPLCPSRKSPTKKAGGGS